MHIPAPTFVLLDTVPVPYPWSVPCAGWAGCTLFGTACTMATFSVSSRPTGANRWLGGGAVPEVTFAVWDSLGGLGSALASFLLNSVGFLPGRLTEASSGGVYCAWISLGRGGASGSDSSSGRHFTPLSTKYKGPLQLQLHVDAAIYYVRTVKSSLL